VRFLAGSSPHSSALLNLIIEKSFSLVALALSLFASTVVVQDTSLAISYVLECRPVISGSTAQCLPRGRVAGFLRCSRDDHVRVDIFSYRPAKMRTRAEFYRSDRGGFYSMAAFTWIV